MCTGGCNLKNPAKRTFQLLENVDGRGEHPCHTPYFALLLPFLFPIIHISSSFPRSLLLLPSYLHLYLLLSLRSLLFYIIALAFSFFTSFSKETRCVPCMIYSDAKIGAESLLQAECTLREFRQLSILPTIIRMQISFPHLYELDFYLLWTEEIASSLWTRNIFF